MPKRLQSISNTQVRVIEILLVRMILLPGIMLQATDINLIPLLVLLLGDIIALMLLLLNLEPAG